MRLISSFLTQQTEHLTDICVVLTLVNSVDPRHLTMFSLIGADAVKCLKSFLSFETSILTFPAVLSLIYHFHKLTKTNSVVVMFLFVLIILLRSPQCVRLKVV